MLHFNGITFGTANGQHYLLKFYTMSFCLDIGVVVWK